MYSDPDPWQNFEGSATLVLSMATPAVGKWFQICAPHLVPLFA